VASYHGVPLSPETTQVIDKSRLSPRVCPQPQAALRDQGEVGAPEVPQLESQVIQYRKINAIFSASPIEITTSRERAIYINEARRSKYPRC